MTFQKRVANEDQTKWRSNLCGRIVGLNCVRPYRANKSCETRRADVWQLLHNTHTKVSECVNPCLRGKTTSTTLESLPSDKKVLKENLYKIMDPCPVNQEVKRPRPARERERRVLLLYTTTLCFWQRTHSLGPRERERETRKCMARKNLIPRWRLVNLLRV